MRAYIAICLLVSCWALAAAREVKSLHPSQGQPVAPRSRHLAQKVSVGWGVATGVGAGGVGFTDTLSGGSADSDGSSVNTASANVKNTNGVNVGNAFGVSVSVDLGNGLGKFSHTQSGAFGSGSGVDATAGSSTKAGGADGSAFGVVGGGN